MLQPKKSNIISKDLDILLKKNYNKQKKLEKEDLKNQFNANYQPSSIKYQKQRQELDTHKTNIKQDNSTSKDKEFNKNIYKQKEWDDKKWGYAEDAASIAELGNFIPHPVAQGIGKVGAAVSATLSARKAKLAYDNEDYVNMGLNLGMMGVSAGLGSKTLSRSTPKLSKLDSFEKAIAPKSFKSNVINGHEIGRITSDVPGYINVLNQKAGQSTGNLLLNRGALGAVGVDLNTDFSTSEYAQGGYLNNSSSIQTNNMNNKQLISQFRLPGYIAGMSFADASKKIDGKFKDRNDLISKRTKEELLNRLSQAQEYVKAQEQPQQEQLNPEQRQFGDGVREPLSMFSSLLKPAEMTGQLPTAQLPTAVGTDNTLGMGNSIVAGGITPNPMGILQGGLALNELAKGNGASRSNLGSAASGAMTGAMAGSSLGPIGMGAGAIIGAGVGLLGANKRRDADAEIGSRNAFNANNVFRDKKYMRLGGPIDPIYGEEENQIKNLQSILGVTPDGFAGKKTKAAWNAYQIPGYDPPVKGTSYQYPWQFNDEKLESDVYQSMGLTPGGRQFKPIVNQITESPYINQNGIAPVNIDSNMINRKSIVNPLNKNMFPKPALINDSESMQPVYDKSGALTTVGTMNASVPATSSKSNLFSNLSKIGNYAKQNITGESLRYAPVAMNALQLSKLRGPEHESLQRLTNTYQPQYMDEASIQNSINSENRNTINALTNASGGSESALRAGILGAGLNATKAKSDAYMKMREYNNNQNIAKQQFQLGIDQTNLGQSNMENDINARNKGNYETQKSKLLAQIGTDLGGIGKEELFKKYPKMMGLGYDWNGKYFVNTKTGDIKTETEAAAAESTTKKAKGGFLSNKSLTYLNSLNKK